MAGLGHLVRDHIWLVVAISTYSVLLFPITSVTGNDGSVNANTSSITTFTVVHFTAIVAVPTANTTTTTTTTTTTSTSTSTSTNPPAPPEKQNNEDADKVESLTIAVIFLAIISTIAIGIIIVGSVCYYRRSRNQQGGGRDIELSGQNNQTKTGTGSKAKRVRQYILGNKNKKPAKAMTVPTISEPAAHPAATATQSLDSTYDPVTVPDGTMLGPGNATDSNEPERGDSIYENTQQQGDHNSEANHIYSQPDEETSRSIKSSRSGPQSAAMPPRHVTRADQAYVNVTETEERGDYAALEDGIKDYSHQYTGLK